MFWKIFLFVLVVLHSGISSKNLYIKKTLSDSAPKEDKVAKCLLFLMHDPSLTFVLNIQIRIETESNIFRREFMDTIESFYALNDRFLVELDTKKDLSHSIHCRFYFIDSLVLLKLLFNSQREELDDLSAERQYYVIMLPANMSSPEGVLEEIFRLCWSSSIINVNVLIEDADGVITIYTYYPFTEKSCTDRTPTIYNRFVNGSFEFNKPTFPRKTNNYWQCPVRMISWDVLPFVVLNQKKLSGFDANIVLNLAEVMNFSLEITISPEERGQVYSNVNSTGGFKMLREGLGDFMIGDCSCTQIRHQFFATSMAYFMSNTHVLIRRPGAYSPLEILLFPFDRYTWFGLVLIFLGKWLSRLLWKKMLVPRSRLYIITGLFSIFILSSSYEGSIFNFFYTRPRKTPPHNLNEAINQGYKFIVTPVYYAFFSPIWELRDEMIILNGSEMENLHYFDRLGGKYGLITSKDYMTTYKANSKHWKNVIVREPVVASYKCIYLPKFSFLTVELNKRLEQAITHGFILKAQRMYLPVEHFRKKKVVRKPINMSLQQLMGAFQLLGIFICTSACVFVMEILSKFNRRLRMTMDVFQ